MNVLVTGSSGLIGSEAVRYYDAQGHRVVGVDNNARRVFFGELGDTTWNLRLLQAETQRFVHFDIDIRDEQAIFALFEEQRFDLIIHCAAQPSHDKAREIPLLDFETNALGTMILLEATRQFAADAPFILMSTNKVYGDSPNQVPLTETDTRYDYAREQDFNGVHEGWSIDQSLHSVFGASKLSADIMAQEYGRYFGLKIGIFRGSCLTGSSHSGVELHGFLSYLVRVAVLGKRYTIYGYKGKQVRDQIHSHDVIRAIDAFARAPRPGEVYNIGGGRPNSASILESIALIERISGRRIEWRYDDRNRLGDHICYITDLSKFRSHYPDWRLDYSLERIITEMVAAEERRVAETSHQAIPTQ